MLKGVFMDKINFKAVPKITYPEAVVIDPRRWMQYSDFDITYSVWERARKWEQMVLRTEDINEAMVTMEALAGKKKFAYIYYSFEGNQYFLCCILDNKFSRRDFRVAVRKLMRPKGLRQGLWA